MPPFSPRIYQIEIPAQHRGEGPTLVHDLGQEFAEARALGFDHVLLDDDGSGCGEALAAAEPHGLKVLLRLSLDQPAAGSAILARHTEWRTGPGGDGDGPGFDDPLPDPRQPGSQPRPPGLRFDDPATAAAITAWWTGRLTHLVDQGVAGFCCLTDGPAPAELFNTLIPAVKAEAPGTRFIAWTPGCPVARVASLAGCGFDAAVSSSAWWDFRASWLADEATRLRAFGAVIALAGPPGQRAATGLDAHRAALERAHRERALWLAVFTGDGVMVSRELLADMILLAGRDQASGDSHGIGLHDPQLFKLALAVCGERSAQAPRRWEWLSSPGASVALIQTSAANSGDADERAGDAGTTLVMAANAGDQALSFDLGSALARFDGLAIEHSAGDFSADGLQSFEPAATHIYTVRPSRPAATGVKDGKRAVDAAAKMPRIAIESIAPCVDNGRFIAKRSVGDEVLVDADIFGEGHDKLAAAVFWRAADEEDWREVPMRMLVNDRWRARFTLPRVGRYQFAVEAWIDVFGAYRNEIDKKFADGQTISLELREGGLLVQAALTRAESEDRRQLVIALKRLLKSLDEASDAAARVALFLSPATHTLMQQADARAFKVRSNPLPIDAERRAAGFSSWYELFPRSMGPDTQTHGTFRDVTKRLPAIQAMGFDTLYFTPIHPIGKKHRKGRNNTLDAGPDDVGSPYAIGSADGGHDAIHPELGTLDDFRQLRREAEAHGLELALDFAIQCSPDHPWLKEHPDWFTWRPDGTIRYAENPPKKYQDIVNVDFYADGAVPKLWLALRDVVLFWVKEGVKVFRVDNPHTKPMPFWEWLIGDVRGRDPAVIFLAEAFTRPKPMYRLGKLGFSQSYSYFTWRHGKQEFIEYLTELTQQAPKDFFRPHFFVNTPDINPYFLQRSGRGGFVLRAALAATLSGLWGVYSGFELCEAAPVPGKEEFLDSEKYELRQRDWNQPGNIVREITLLNQIRRSNPALQTHLGVRFCESSGDQVLCFTKTAGSNIVFTAICLDPNHAQACTFELPLEDWGLPEGAAVVCEDLVHGHSFTLHGRHQRLHLDPATLAFTIWRLRPEGVL
ncbi:MAG: alpha-1,4-glucan--maltose-1-phosphate maltosyltransferase [Polaromonas sp.]|nr:alpha-1,4-glucan--maltose-1-phosphate maltosyltransferase [Polaromonas sp.]